MPISKWMDQKTVVHLHNGILCGRKKAGVPILCDSMDGNAEYYAKWNKPGGERQIPCDLICKWNIINKTTKQANYNQRHWIKNKLTVARGEVGGDNGGKGGEGLSGTCIKDTWATPKGGTIEGGRWGCLGLGGVVGGKWRQLYLNNNKKMQERQLTTPPKKE